jgi:hypothetical protein
VHNNASPIVFSSLIVAALLWSLPVLALGHRSGVTGNSCDIGDSMQARVRPSRDEEIPLPRVATDLICAAYNGDYRPLRIDKTGLATHLREWMIADVAAATVDGERFGQIEPCVFPHGRQFQLFLDKSALVDVDIGIRHGINARPVTGVRDGGDMSVFLDDAGKQHNGRERRDRSDDTRQAEQGNGLSLLQNVPLPMHDARSSGNTEGEGRWARLPDSPFPEPGNWAMVIAGLLGMCAVARPRLHSS